MKLVRTLAMSGAAALAFTAVAARADEAAETAEEVTADEAGVADEPMPHTAAEHAIEQALEESALPAGDEQEVPPDQGGAPSAGSESRRRRRRRGGRRRRRVAAVSAVPGTAHEPAPETDSGTADSGQEPGPAVSEEGDQ